MRFKGDRVRVRRVGHGVLLEPLVTDPTEWFARLDDLQGDAFMAEGREQPQTPRRKIFGPTR
jgi:antitoxin VapB